ncbi:MAG: diacylglycerol kinase family protein [Bacilli bacterium]|nr:diacylglycerol kinase family protein [Bacilli bacterium]
MELEEKTRSKVKRKLRIDRKRLAYSFKYAFQGIKQSYKGEQNLKIHTFIAILVIVFAFFLKISFFEWVIVLVLIGLVLMAEFFNTAIEYTVDLASPKIHPLAKAAKDTASAGVLVIAIISAIIGLLIFVPKIIEYLGGLQ